jgi:hypothetical protein
MSYRVKLTQSTVEQAQEIVQYISRNAVGSGCGTGMDVSPEAEIGSCPSCPDAFL